jgi:hypothetical protein
MNNFKPLGQDLESLQGPEIKLGEIRRLIDMELQHDSRLVVVLEHNRADDSYLVGLVSNLTEISTPQDLHLPADLTKAPFDLVVLADFSARVWRQQLDTSPVFGVIPTPSLFEIKDAVYRLGSDESGSQLERGQYLTEFGDHVWLYRGKEIDALNLLSQSNSISESNIRFFEIWRQPNSEVSLTDLILQNQLGVELLEEFFTNDSIRMELV